MGIKITGDAEMEAKVDALNYGVQKNARAALKSGANLFLNRLKEKTPIWKGEQTDSMHMVNDTTMTGIKQSGGELTIEVGYGKETGHRVHFPNSGTSRQSPQHFVEETQVEMHDRVLQEFFKFLKV